MSETAPIALPQEGQLWKCPPLRGTWRVRAIGRLYITFESTIPGLTPQKVAITDFPAGHIPGSKWERYT